MKRVSDKKILRLFILLLAAATLSLSAFFATSCNKRSEKQSGGDPEPAEAEVSVSFKRAEYLLEEFRTLDLSIELVTENAEGKTFVWESADKSVVQVHADGSIEAVKAGSTDVTVKIGEKSASCLIKVLPTAFVPTMTFEDGKNIPLTVGGSYATQRPRVYMNGEELSEAEIAWTVYDDGIVGVDDNGDGSAVITALSAGETEVYVSATVRGMTVYDKVTVSVKENGVLFDVSGNGIKRSANGYSASIKAVEKVVGDKTAECLPTVIATYGGQELTETVTWEVSGDAVTVDPATGKITAESAGTATVVGSLGYEGKTYNVVIEVTVTQTETDKGAEQFIALNRAATSFVETVDPDEKGVEISVNGNKIDGIEFTSSDGKVYIPNEAYATTEIKDGTSFIELKTDKRVYTFDAEIIDYAVKTDAEFAVAFTPDNLTSHKHIVLESDFDKSGYSFGIEYNTDPFNAILDGNGHVIKNMNAAWNGFIYNFAENGVIRNISFTGIKFHNGGDCKIVAYRLYGTLENCFFEATGGKNETEARAALAAIIGKNAVIKNTVVYVHDREYLSGNCINEYFENGAVIEGLYVVNTAPFGSEHSDGDLVGAKGFHSIDEFSSEVKSVPDGFGDGWTMLGGKVLVTASAAAVYESAYGATSLALDLPTDTARIDERFDLSVRLDGAAVTGAIWKIDGLSENQYELGDDYMVVTDETLVDETFYLKGAYYVGGIYYRETDVKTISVGGRINRSVAQNRVDFDLGTDVRNYVVANADSAELDIGEIFAAVQNKDVYITYNYQKIYEGKITANKITVSLGKFTTADGGEGNFEIFYSDGGKDYAITLPVNMIKNEEFELNQTVIPKNNDSAKNLKSIIDSYPTGTFVLTEDLDMNGAILLSITEFKGVFDGNGHAIKNTLISYDNAVNNWTPRFIFKNSGTIKDLRVELNDYNIKAGNPERGFIHENVGTVSNVYLVVRMVTELNDEKNSDGTWKHNFRNGRDAYGDDYANTGFLTMKNNGSIENCVVSVVATDSIKNSLGKNVFGILAVVNYGTIARSYVVKNGLDNADAVLAGNTSGYTEGDTYECMTNETFTAADGWKFWQDDNGILKYNGEAIYKFFKARTFSVSNAETTVRIGETLALQVKMDEDVVSGATFAVTGLADGEYTLDGNMLGILGGEKGKKFTVTATYAVNGTTFTATKELEVGSVLVKKTAENAVEIDLGLKVSSATVVTSESATMDISEIASDIEGKSVAVKYNGSTIYSGTPSGNSITVSLSAFSAASGGADNVQVLYAEGSTEYEITVPVTLKRVVELNSTVLPKNSAAKDLQSVIGCCPDATFVFTSDVNMGGQNLKVLKTFTGVIDGNGYAITNTSMNWETDGVEDGVSEYKPRFIRVNGGTIKNLRIALSDYAFHLGNYPRGLIDVNEGTVENVYLQVTIATEPVSSADDRYQRNMTPDATHFAAVSVLSRINSGTIKNSVVNIKRTTTANLGDNVMGLIAYQNNGTIENCYAVKNNVNAKAIVAGTVTGATEVADIDALLAAETFDAANGWSAVWNKKDGINYFGAYSLTGEVPYSADYKLKIDGNVYKIMRDSAKDETESTAMGFDVFKLGGLTGKQFTGTTGSKSNWTQNDDFRTYGKLWFALKVTTDSVYFDMTGEKGAPMEANAWYYFFIDLDEGKAYYSSENGGYTSFSSYAWFSNSYGGQIRMYDIFRFSPKDETATYDVFVSDAYYIAK